MEEDKYKYVIPVNYKEESKFLGIVKYSIVFEILLFLFLIFVLLSIFNVNTLTKIYVLMFFGIPFSIFDINGFEGRGVINFLVCFYKFKRSCKVYIFDK